MATIDIDREVPQNAPATSGYGSPLYQYYVLFTLTLVYTINLIDRALLNVVAQPVIRAFGLTDLQFGFLAGPPFALFYALAGIPIASIADKCNRVALVALCVFIWSVMSACCGLATSFLFLLIARIGVAVGEAGGTPASTSLLSNYFSPQSRPKALAIFASGSMMGGALANYIGGYIVKTLDGATIYKALLTWNAVGLAQITDWSKVEGWRVAFVLLGVPGILVSCLLLLSVKEPPREHAKPGAPAKFGTQGTMATVRELGPKSTYWVMNAGAALAATASYGMASFKAPMFQRIYGMDPAEFALRFGGPLAIMSALGVLAGGFIIERLGTKFKTTVALLPAGGLICSVPFYYMGLMAPVHSIKTLGLTLWCLAVFLHWLYLGSTYTIAQAVIGPRGRATAVAILLLITTLFGSGLGPLVTGALSDLFMGWRLHSVQPGLTTTMCRDGHALAALSSSARDFCRSAYGEGLRDALMTSTALLIPAGLLFYRAGRTLRRDAVVE